MNGDRIPVAGVVIAAIAISGRIVYHADPVIPSGGVRWDGDLLHVNTD